MKNSLFVLFVAFICQLGSSQTAIFSGIITDANTKEPLIGATVFLNNQTGTATDIDGSFKIVTTPGDYTFTASYVGYDKQSASITLTERASLVLDIALKPVDGILNTIVVTGSKFEKKLGEETVTIDVIKSDLIQHTNDVKLDQTIQRIPGVSVIDGQANIRGGSGYSYGAGSRVLLLMDDLPILTGDAGFP
ncbi:MAG: TonB-dependent receptor, partial [Chitinophagales bacterium]|nr:TonB-dependent receptor [Chitinophagales bacterium]